MTFSDLYPRFQGHDYLTSNNSKTIQDRAIFTMADHAGIILLLAPSVCELDNFFKICERELKLLGMAINFKKSSCIRIGHRMDASCVTISSSTGSTLSWVKELSYLGVHIQQSRTFKCSLSNHRKAFYRSANAIFEKIGRIASEDVILQLIKSKCIPSLLYGFDACVL